LESCCKGTSSFVLINFSVERVQLWEGKNWGKLSERNVMKKLKLWVAGTWHFDKRRQVLRRLA